VHFKYIDKIINVTDMDSFHYARQLAKEEGIFAGGSTGTILAAVLKVARTLNENDVIVFIVCDTGERYLSKFHSDEWLREKRLLPSDVKTLRDISRAKSRNGMKELVYLHIGDKVKTAVEVLNGRGYSQLPVMEEGKSVGSIREARVMARLLEDPDLLDARIDNIMGPGFPTLDERTEVNIVKKYLSDSPAILVTEYGRIKDIITRYDILEYV
jgi:cystathionine beta-synthase